MTMHALKHIRQEENSYYFFDPNAAKATQTIKPLFIRKYRLLSNNTFYLNVASLLPQSRTTIDCFNLIKQLQVLNFNKSHNLKLVIFGVGKTVNLEVLKCVLEPLLVRFKKVSKRFRVEVTQLDGNGNIICFGMKYFDMGTLKKLVHRSNIPFAAWPTVLTLNGQKLFRDIRRFRSLDQLSLELKSYFLFWGGLNNQVLQRLKDSGQMCLVLNYNNAATEKNVLILPHRDSNGLIIDCICSVWFISGFSIFNIREDLPFLLALKINFESDDSLIGQIDSEPITSPSNLKELSFSFCPKFSFTIEGFAQLCSFINSFGQLQTLSLSFDGFHIDDTSLKLLSSCITNSLKTLRNLKICLNHGYNITDKGMEAFGSCFISTFQVLKSIELSFIECDNITDAGVKLLGYLISNPLQALKTLNLSFVKCGRITSNGISFLKSCISSSNEDLLSFKLKYEQSTCVFDDQFYEPDGGPYGEDDFFIYYDDMEVKNYYQDMDFNYENSIKPEYYQDYADHEDEEEDYPDYENFYPGDLYEDQSSSEDERWV